MKITVKRRWFTAKTTIGEMWIDGKFECFTLEDLDRGPGAAKVFGQTAIPEGVYGVIINFSPHFGMDMPLLENVPGFQGVRIHSGNVAADTEGCILVGQTRGVDRIDHSRDAFHAFFPKLQAAISAGQTVELTVCKQP